jgi:ABC-type glycerol-3-phosphate transport system permease component
MPVTWGLSVILPIAAPGIAAAALLCVIFTWNEYFYAIQLNFAGASTPDRPATTCASGCTAACTSSILRR